MSACSLPANSSSTGPRLQLSASSAEEGKGNGPHVLPRCVSLTGGQARRRAIRGWEEIAEAITLQVNRWFGEKKTWLRRKPARPFPTGGVREIQSETPKKQLGLCCAEQR